MVENDQKEIKTRQSNLEQLKTKIKTRQANLE